jgi:ABC-type transport system involved in cytochrome bd biosynthesis fused ATPase/permease subunit
VAVAAVVLAPLSTSSGEELEHRVGHSSLVERHAELGDRLIWFVLPLAVFAVLGYVLHRRGHLADGGSRAPVATMAVLPVLAALAAVAVLVQVVLIGHSGAEAAWSDVGSSSQSAGSADGG